MKRILPLLFTCTFSFTLTAQSLVSAEFQGTVSAQILNLFLPISVQYGVDSYKLTYTTTDPFGQQDTVTGLMTLPVGSPLVAPTVVYNHGTVGARDEVPSVVGVLERQIPQAFSGFGFVALAPDYIGLGDSDGIHPYLHADTEAGVGRDMILAAREYLIEQGFAYNDDIFVTGYSQGGHASMALAQRMEANPGQDGLTLTAAAHLSGSYDLNAPAPQVLQLTSINPNALSFTLNTLISYNYVYDWYGGIEGLFVEPYLTEAQRFLDEEQDLYEFGLEVDTLMMENSHTFGDIFTAAFNNDVTNGAPRIVDAYNDNDVFNWAPTAPALLYYCNADETVNPQNSITTADIQLNLGADSILLTDGGEFNHVDCATPAAITALQFFLGFASFEPSSIGEPVARPDLVLAPNPVAAGETVRLSGLPAQQHSFIVYDLSGRAVLSGETGIDGSIRLPSQLARGPKVIRIGLSDGTSVVRRIIVE
ncbi:MAG: hypothetical protein AAF828_11000 [Bacteroidota bacterium]